MTDNIKAKYAILDTYWKFDTSEYIDKHESAWVAGVQFNGFTDGESMPTLQYTHALGEAKIYTDFAEASMLVDLITVPPACTARVVQVSDKEIFESRLSGK